MASTLQLYQPFNLLANICSVIDFCPANKGPLLIGVGNDEGYKAINQEGKCTRCCPSAGYSLFEPNYCAAPTHHSPELEMLDVDRSHIGAVPYGQRIKHCKVNGTIALTFDDGPSAWSTDLLDVLLKNNVKATFFIIGREICKGQARHFPSNCSSIIKRMYDEGHQIGSHTWSHNSMDEQSTGQRIQDMLKMELALSEILGVVPTYWRPPFGNCYTPQCQNDLGGLGYHTIHWDIDTRDWEGNYTLAEEEILSNISRFDSANSTWLPLFHETHRRTVHGFTQWVIDRSRERGYKIVRLGECLGDPEQNWYRRPRLRVPSVVSRGGKEPL